MATTNIVEGPRHRGGLSVLRTVSRPSLLAFGVALLAIASCGITYAIVTGGVTYRPTQGLIVGLLLVNLALVLTLGALIAWRLTRLWSERQSGRAGARPSACHAPRRPAPFRQNPE